MIIEGNHPIVATTKDIWKLLMDPEVLKRITPGISELTPLEEDKFQALSTIKIGPVKGKFEGQLELRDKTEGSAATIVIDQKSQIGNVTAEIRIQLNQNEDTTEIDYKGTASLTGKLAMMGQRIIGGVVKTLSKQFFKALEKEINPNNE